MEIEIEEQVEKRFSALRRVHPLALSIRHRLVWQWLEDCKECHAVLELVDQHAPDRASHDGIVQAVISGSEPMSVLASTQTHEEYVCLAYAVARRCAESSNDRLELELAKRLGARGDDAVELFFDLVLEPVGRWMANKLVVGPVNEEVMGDDGKSDQLAEFGGDEQAVVNDEPALDEPGPGASEEVDESSREPDAASIEPQEAEPQHAEPSECDEDLDDFPNNHGEPWEDEDVDHLVDLIEFGLEIPEIAETLGRTIRSIAMRIDVLVDEGRLFTPGAARLLVVGPDEEFYQSWEEILGFVDEDWRPLARGLRNCGVKPPTDVHAPLDIDGGDSELQGLMIWEDIAPPVVLISGADATNVSIPDVEIVFAYPSDGASDLLARLGEQLEERNEQKIPEVPSHKDGAGSDKGPSMVEYFEVIRQKQKDGALPREIASELGVISFFVSTVLKLRFLPEEIRSRVHYHHYADELAKWETSHLDERGIPYRVDDAGNIVVQSIARKNALAIANLVAEYQRENELSKEKAREVMSGFLLLSENLFAVVGGSETGVLGAAHIMSPPDFEDWLKDAAIAAGYFEDPTAAKSLSEGSINPQDSVRVLEPTTKMEGLLERIDIHTINELLNLEFKDTRLSPRGKKAQAIRRLQEQAKRRLQEEESIVVGTEIEHRGEHHQALSFSYDPVLSSGSKIPSVGQRFDAIEERLSQGASLEDIAGEMGESTSYVMALHKLRFVPERMRLLVHHDHYSHELATWEPYRLEEKGIRFHLDNDGEVVIHGISWKNALALANFVNDYQRRNRLSEKRVNEIMDRFFRQTDIPFEHRDGRGFGLIDAARLLSFSEFEAWLEDTVTGYAEVAVDH